MKQLNLFIFLLSLLASPKLIGQLNVAEKHLTILQGQTVYDTIYSQHGLPTALVENCWLRLTSLGNKKFRIEISAPQANPNYLGYAWGRYQYTHQNRPYYIVYRIRFVQSRIQTQNDYVAFENSAVVSVNPLLNDTGSHGLELVGISQVQGGTASISGDQIEFNPNGSDDKAYLVYAVKDSLGGVANGMVYFYKNQTTNVASSDTTRFSIVNTQSYDVFVPNDDFLIATTPNKGQLSNVAPAVFKYTPNPEATGDDVFKFSDSQGNEKVVVATLIQKQINRSSVRDDVFFTPKNTPITFDVFANDLSTYFPIVSYSSGLVWDTLGIFTYTPPTGFAGEKNFTYKVHYGGYQYTGKVKLYIGNYAPKQNLDYSFNTLKNKALTLSYDVPINGYTFNVLNSPEYGNLEVFYNTNISDDCNEVSSKATLVYTPYEGYYGADSCDIEYCVDNNPCIVYKLAFQVFDFNDSICPCVGPNCVWAGDLNGNGHISVADLLPLGRFMGLNGASRNDDDIPYFTGQHANDWNYSQANGINIKHIDANGDGLIAEDDLMAIDQHYSNISNLVPQEVLSVKDYHFELVPNTTNLDSGDLLVLDVVIGTSSKPVVDAFGLAYEIVVPESLIDSASFEAQFDKNGWFTANASSLQMAKQPQKGVLQCGVVRITPIVTDELEGFKPTGGSGSGKIGQMVFIVTDELEGFKTKYDFVVRRIRSNGIEFEDVDGQKYQLPDTYLDVKVNLKKSTPIPSEEKLVLYPNPTNEDLYLHFNGRNTIYGYQVFDGRGSLLLQQKEVNQQSALIETDALPTGIYTVQVITSIGVITKKVTILDK